MSIPFLYVLASNRNMLFLTFLNQVLFLYVIASNRNNAVFNLFESRFGEVSVPHDSYTLIPLFRKAVNVRPIKKCKGIFCFTNK